MSSDPSNELKVAKVAPCEGASTDNNLGEQRPEAIEAIFKLLKIDWPEIAKFLGLAAGFRTFFKCLPDENCEAGKTGRDGRLINKINCRPVSHF